MGRDMFGRARTGSTLCPSCGMLVGVNDEQCLGCGRRRPGMFGFTSLLRLGNLEDVFVPLVMWVCGAVYLACLTVDVRGIEMSGLSFLSPSLGSEFLFGCSGAVPLLEYGRWWTPLSATWLHGGALHILFNMMWLRQLGPAVAHLYGGARTVIIYALAGVVGFLASSLAGAFLPRIPFLQGSDFTLGASASVFGLMGAVLHFGRRGGSSHARESATRWIIYGLAFGFVMPGVDNWAHLGGLAGGYFISRWLDPMRPERGTHTIVALACLLLSFASILLSVVTALPMFRQG
jgi:membrane associated rhomboid family serine protease